MIGFCDDCKKLRNLSQYRLCHKCQAVNDYEKIIKPAPAPSLLAYMRRPWEKKHHPSPPPPELSKRDYQP